MATNVFFNQAVKTEQNLVEDLIVESLRFYGHNCYYLPRKIVNEDTILGDAAESSFEDAYEIEMYLEGTEGFEGEGELYSKFGIETRDSASFIISRRSWERFVSLDANLATGLRPNEGDLIYFPLSKSLFEIKFVEHENVFYQLGKLYTFKMSCDLYEYSGEDFNTSISEIDTDMDLASGPITTLTLANTPTLRDFVIGEKVSQMITDTIIIQGTVAAWSEDTNKLSIGKISSNDTTDTYQSFVLTDTTEGNILAEDSLDNDKIILSGTGQEGYYIDFETGTAGVELPSYITDGITGTDNIKLETFTQGDSISLESGMGDTTSHDNIVLEDSLASRRSVNSVGETQEMSNDPGAFNLDIETDADGIIDFSEANPFGDAT
ncbi:neck protein [uncultured Mediterranean phage]|nr:neck protein [uncultured Mediterranean phage]